MVIIKLMGGLGNQMFQYAFGRTLRENGTEIKYDTSYYNHIPDGDTSRTCELSHIVSDLPTAGQQDLRKYQNIVQKVLRIIDIYAGTKLSAVRMEENKDFDISFMEEKDKYLIGYWQNEDYFKRIREELLKDFAFPVWELNEVNIKLSQEISEAENAVAVHVRGGDYFSANNIKIFGNICTAEYYERAFNYFENRYDNVKFFLFTNDVKWVNRNINIKEHDIEQIDWNNDSAGWIDMYHMSKCKHNIIANSSYSWWAAWLNRNKDKIVVAPDKWANNDTFLHIVPEDWVRIK